MLMNVALYLLSIFHALYCDNCVFLVYAFMLIWQVVALKEDGCPKVWVATSDNCQQQAAYGAVCILLVVRPIFVKFMRLLS